MNTPSRPEKKRPFTARTPASPKSPPHGITMKEATDAPSPTKQGQGDNGCVLKGDLRDPSIAYNTINAPHVTISAIEEQIEKMPIGPNGRMTIFPINRHLYMQDTRPRVVKFIASTQKDKFGMELEKAVELTQRGVDLNQTSFIYPIAAAIMDFPKYDTPQKQDPIQSRLLKKCGKIRNELTGDLEDHPHMRLENLHRLYCLEMVQANGNIDAQGNVKVRTLSEYPDRHFTTSQSKTIYEQAKLLLETLHSKGLYHGDFHGGNVIVDQDANNPNYITVQLIDFSYNSEFDKILQDQKDFITQFIFQLATKTKQGPFYEKLHCICNAKNRIKVGNEVVRLRSMDVEELYNSALKLCQAPPASDDRASGETSNKPRRKYGITARALF